MSETNRKITAFQARTHLGELLDQIRYSRKPVVIERHGKPVAVLMDIETYEKRGTPQQYRDWIQEAVEQIKTHYKPAKIILFGSATKGEIREGSDIDLFIIKDTDKRKLDRIDEVLEMLDLEIPVDLHIYTPEEVERRLALGDFFVREIVEDGKILYDSKQEKSEPGKRMDTKSHQ